MMDEQWAREHIGTTPAVRMTADKIAVMRDAIESHPHFSLGGDALSVILDDLEAARVHIAQLEAQRGGAGVVSELWVYHVFASYQNGYTPRHVWDGCISRSEAVTDYEAIRSIKALLMKENFPECPEEGRIVIESFSLLSSPPRSAKGEVEG